MFCIVTANIIISNLWGTNYSLENSKNTKINIKEIKVIWKSILPFVNYKNTHGGYIWTFGYLNGPYRNLRFERGYSSQGKQLET